MDEDVEDRQRRICSHATIQSDPKGQFTEILDRIRDAQDYKANIEKFSRYENDLDRICFAGNFLQCLEVVPRRREKDAGEAQRFRMEGNELFQKKKMAEAFRAYNTSVLRSPQDDSCLVLAIANRSACLFHMKEYDKTIADIHSAIALGYPENQRHKLYLRLAKCYLRTGRPNRAKPALLISKNFLKEHSPDRKIEQEIEELLEKCNNTADLAVSNDSAQVEKKEELRDGPNKSISSFSSRLEVRFLEDVGRHVVAGSEIEAGDVLVAEEPFAATLYPEKFGLNCQTCFERLTSVVPCQDCSGVAYCSVGCRDKANASFHKYECKVIEVMAGFGCSQVARLAYRMIAQKPLKHFLDLKDELMSKKPTEGEKGFQKTKSKYVQVFQLVANNCVRWSEDLFKRSLMAGILLKLLHVSGYFPSDGSNTKFDEVFIGSLLLRNLEVLQFNAHEVYEVLRGSKNSIKPFKNNVIGLAIYPRASYFNHSCHGAVARYFKGTKLFLKAARPIAKGQEVHENYGPTFYFKRREERQKHLRARYWFDCRCPACQEDWPLLEGLAKNKVTKASSVIDRAMQLMTEGKVEAAADIWCRVSNKCWPPKPGQSGPPTEECIRAEDKLRTCISNMGNIAYVPQKEKENK